MKYCLTVTDMEGVKSGPLDGDFVQVIAKTEAAYLSTERLEDWAFPIVDAYMRLYKRPHIRFHIVFADKVDSGVVIGGEDLMDDFVTWCLAQALIIEVGNAATS